MAGVLSQVSYDTPGTTNNKPSGDEFSWGINASSVINASNEDQLKLQAVYGDGVAGGYMNDAGNSLAVDKTDVRTLKVFGGLIYYDHNRSNSLNSSIGYTTTKLGTFDTQSPDAFRKGSVASVNFLGEINKGLMWGIEAYWEERENVDGSRGENIRVQFSFKANFDLGHSQPNFST